MALPDAVSLPEAPAPLLTGPELHVADRPSRLTIGDQLYTHGAVTGLAAAGTTTGARAGRRLRTLPRAATKTMGKPKTYAPANYGSVSEALLGLYTGKVKDVERDMLFDRFTTSLLSDAELLAKPMVLLLGQYSSGKTSFIRYLAGKDFPAMHIGPEPTTDGFAALMDGASGTAIPGNAATSSKSRPFRALSKFGSAFLNKFWTAFTTSSTASASRDWRFFFAECLRFPSVSSAASAPSL